MSETVAHIFLAFVENGTWSQSELARRCGVQVATVRKHLVSLQGRMRLERERDDSQVYWSVPRGWFPGGSVLTETEAAHAARLIARLPKTNASERLLRKLLLGGSPPNAPGNEAPAMTSEEILTVIEDCVAGATVLRVRYYSISGADLTSRLFSVHRIVYGSGRLVATCHRDGRLKWLRIDRVERPAAAPEESFRSQEPEALDRFCRHSFGGFSSGGEPVACAFFVREAEAKWVRHNLPDATLTVEPADGGIVVRAETNAVHLLARFVVGLGPAARAETPALREAVLELARGALSANGGVARRVQPVKPEQLARARNRAARLARTGDA